MIIITNLLQQKRLEKTGGRGRGKYTIMYVCQRRCNNLTESSNDVTNNKEKDNGTTCKICKISSIELTDKEEDWVQCDICDQYIFPKCFDRTDIFADDDCFVVSASLNHKY